MQIRSHALQAALPLLIIACSQSKVESEANSKRGENQVAVSRADQILRSQHGFPKCVSLSQIQILLQKTINSTYGKGFKNLGVDEDFYHGHIIFGKEPCHGPDPMRNAVIAGEDSASLQKYDRYQPVAILYHTQELAFDAERTGDMANGYINKMKRNWLQLWETGEVYDASEYLLPGQQMNDKYTIYDRQLDPTRLKAYSKSLVDAKTGVKMDMIWDTFQFSFYRPSAEGKEKGSEGDAVIFEMSIPGGNKVALQVFSTFTRHHVNRYLGVQ